MKFSQLFTPALLAALPYTTLALPSGDISSSSLSPRQETYGQETPGVKIVAPDAWTATGTRTCQTSGSSPKTGDITAVINELYGRGGGCKYEDRTATSHCEVQASSGTAAIGLCDGMDYPTSCSLIAAIANDIQQNCLSEHTDNGRAGGMFTYTESSGISHKVIVYAS